MLEAKIFEYYKADDLSTLPAFYMPSEGVMFLIKQESNSKNKKIEVYVGERARTEYYSMLTGSQIMTEEQKQVPVSVAKWVNAVYNAINPPNEIYPCILDSSNEDMQPDDMDTFAKWVEKVNLAEYPSEEVRDFLIEFLEMAGYGLRYIRKKGRVTQAIQNLLKRSVSND